MPISHILEAKQFSRPQIEALLAASAKMEQALKRGQKLNHLSGKVVACLFFEPSTRTRLSFEAAALRLGGQVISMESGLVSSSAFKGESLEDTMRMVQSYADCVVVRHPRAGAVQDMATVAAVPVINAGDGGNQHPTQALLDLYTIKKELGRLHNLNIAFGFDPKHSRTIRSLALLLTHFSGNRFT
ncbi:MAG: aspartate carbamoyltransferase, partial [Patescibacteria group bacterium]|nr:aspartate carbamoyltransferase [Patescibacteria group bacterium]